MANDNLRYCSSEVESLCGNSCFIVSARLSGAYRVIWPCRVLARPIVDIRPNIHIGELSQLQKDIEKKKIKGALSRNFRKT